MTIQTLEIRGKAVACIAAEDRAAADHIVRQSWLHRDLLSHKSAGAPLWDGATELSLRQSTQEEAEIVAKRFAEHHLTKDPHDLDKGAIVFLVAIDGVDEGANDDQFEDYLV